jgi:hypothetical protein
LSHLGLATLASPPFESDPADIETLGSRDDFITCFCSREMGAFFLICVWWVSDGHPRYVCVRVRGVVGWTPSCVCFSLENVAVTFRHTAAAAAGDGGGGGGGGGGAAAPAAAADIKYPRGGITEISLKNFMVGWVHARLLGGGGRTTAWRRGCVAL